MPTYPRIRGYRVYRISPDSYLSIKNDREG